MPENEKGKKRTRGKSYALQEILDHLDEVEKMARNGATEAQIAKCFGISKGTLYNYKKSNLEIFSAIKKGRTNLVDDLKGTLIKKAKGFSYTEKKQVLENGKVVREEIYTKAALPDVAALNLLLKNYAEDWKNDPAEYELKKRAIEVQEKKLEQNEFGLLAQ